MLNLLRKAGFEKTPAAHVVLGSGYAEALRGFLAENGNQWSSRAQFPFEELQGLRRSTVEGHSGTFELLCAPTGKCVVVQVGRLHGYEGYSPKDVIAPVMVSRAIGVRHFVLTNSSGSLNPTYDPGDVMVIQDHVNLTGHNPLIGPNPTDSKTKKPLGPRFPDLRNLYDREISAQLLRSLDQQKMRAHLGTYLGVLGPSFETPAEVRLFSKWGLDAVGMSTVWEAIALAHSGATVAGVALISNVGCGLRDDAPLDHHEILRTSKAAAQKIISSVFQVVANLPEDR